jgi:lipid-binding SYLF domain-containing protein
VLLHPATTVAQDKKFYKDKMFEDDVKNAIQNFQSRDSTLAKFFTDAEGYAVFPNVGKGGLGLGIAHGNGHVFAKGGAMIGTASLSQVTLGAQVGGQEYSEVIFFESRSVFEEFKEGKLKMSAQVSAVISAEGAAANARYQNGVLIFTFAKGGAMLEASVGGQKFKFTSKPQ